MRHARARPFSDARRVDWDISPADRLNAMVPRRAFKRLFAESLQFRVLRQERHRNRVTQSRG